MIGQYVRLAAGTLRTRLQGQREQQPINVVNDEQQAAAPARRKRKSETPPRLRSDAVTQDEVQRIREMYQGGVLIRDITASTGRSHSVVYQVTADLPRRLDKTLGPRVRAMHNAGKSYPEIAGLLGIDRRRVWQLCNRRTKRRGE